jgi:hypothetical protein
MEMDVDPGESSGNGGLGSDSGAESGESSDSGEIPERLFTSEDRKHFQAMQDRFAIPVFKNTKVGEDNGRRKNAATLRKTTSQK